MVFRRIFPFSISSSSRAKRWAQFHLPGSGGGGSSAPKAPKKGTTAAPVQTAGPVNSPFDYYVLALSWAPGFCADPANAAANPKECAPARHTGFVVHGLWPEANAGSESGIV